MTTDFTIIFSLEDDYKLSLGKTYYNIRLICTYCVPIEQDKKEKGQEETKEEENK